MLEIRVAALSHDIAIQDAALCRIDHVFGHGTEQPVHRSKQRKRLAGLVVFAVYSHRV